MKPSSSSARLASTPRTATPSTTTPPHLSRALLLLVLLNTLLPPPYSSSSPLSLPSSSSSSRSSLSSMLEAKDRILDNFNNNNPKKRTPSLLKRSPPLAQTDCNNALEVSAICYKCAALSPKDFHTIHKRCCLQSGPVRDLCVGWYTEDPKEGRKLKYF